MIEMQGRRYVRRHRTMQKRIAIGIVLAAALGAASIGTVRTADAQMYGYGMMGPGYGQGMTGPG
jgi:hypothetical protein